MIRHLALPLVLTCSLGRGLPWVLSRNRGLSVVGISGRLP